MANGELDGLDAREVLGAQPVEQAGLMARLGVQVRRCACDQRAEQIDGHQPVPLGLAQKLGGLALLDQAEDDERIGLGGLCHHAADLGGVADAPEDAKSPGRRKLEHDGATGRRTRLARTVRHDEDLAARLARLRSLRCHRRQSVRPLRRSASRWRVSAWRCSSVRSAVATLGRRIE